MNRILFEVGLNKREWKAKWGMNGVVKGGGPEMEWSCDTEEVRE